MNKFIKIKYSDGFDIFVRIDNIQTIQYQEWKQKNVKTDQMEIGHAYIISLCDGQQYQISKEEYEKILKNIEIIS